MDTLADSAKNIGQGLVPEASVNSIAQTAKTIANIGAVMGTVSGTLPKAMLFVPKLSSAADLDPVAAISGLAGKAAAKLGGSIGADIKGMANQDVLALRALVGQKKASAKASGLNKFVSGAGQILGDPNAAAKVEVKAAYAAIKTGLAAQNYVSMEMQYNPSSIRMYSTGGRLINTQGAGDMGARIRTNAQTRTTLTAQLVFQQVNESDAFWFEGINIARGINTAVNIAKTAFGDGYTVQPQVEALLSLIHFKTAKQVIFFWSQMFFHGELVSVNANYQMFNKLGYPIKATVDITLQEPDDSLEYESDNLAWEQAFDQAFGEAGISNVTKMANGISDVLFG